MPPKDSQEELKKKILYYLDEAVVFAFMFMAVLFKETVTNLAKGDVVTNLVIKAPKIIGATLVTIIVYGSMNESFKYSSKEKPPIMKRLAQAVLHGFGWQSLFDM